MLCVRTEKKVGLLNKVGLVRFESNFVIILRYEKKEKKSTKKSNCDNDKTNKQLPKWETNLKKVKRITKSNQQIIKIERNKMHLNIHVSYDQPRLHSVGKP